MQTCPQGVAALPSDLHIYLRPLPLSILPFGPDTHQQFELRDVGPLGTMERGLMGHPPTHSAHRLGSGGVWLNLALICPTHLCGWETRKLRKRNSGQWLGLSCPRGRESGSWPAPTLPSLSRPQVTALPAPQSQHLCLGTPSAFESWGSSLAFTPVSSSWTSPFPCPSCCVLRAVVCLEPHSMSPSSTSQSVSQNPRLCRMGVYICPLRLH